MAIPPPMARGSGPEVPPPLERTLEIPWILPAEAKHQIFESACLTGILSGARALESDAAGSK